MTQIYVALGSNYHATDNIAVAITRLKHCFGELSVSPIYASAAQGFDGADFYNAVVGFHSDLDPETIVATLKRIEAACGRVHGSRKISLDLDLLLYGAAIRQTSRCTVPHPDVLNCTFVLRPLADIAGQQRHPSAGASFATLWQRSAGRAPRLRDVSKEFSL